VRLFAVPVLALLAISLIPIPASADHDDRDRLEIRGVVVAIDWFARTFYLQGRTKFSDHRLWLVVVDRRTDFDVKRRRDHDEDDRVRDFDHRDRWLRLLDVGDAVEVEGRLIGRRTILAREVEVFARHRPVLAPPVVIVPAPPVVIVPAPVIIFPRHGFVVIGREFILSGRAAPRSQVVIAVVTVLGAAVVWKHDLWAFADDDGHFNVMIRPGFIQRGVQHQITVRSRMQGGAESPPVTVVVHQD
jgi:hypothetical protein